MCLSSFSLARYPSLCASSLLSRLQSHALVRRHYNLVVALPYASSSANELDFWNAVRHAMRSALPASSSSAADAQATWTASERAALSGAPGGEERALLRYPSLAVARTDVRCVCLCVCAYMLHGICTAPVCCP